MLSGPKEMGKRTGVGGGCVCELNNGQILKQLFQITRRFISHTRTTLSLLTENLENNNKLYSDFLTTMYLPIVAVLLKLKF